MKRLGMISVRLALVVVLVSLLGACAPGATVNSSLNPGESKTVHMVAHCGFRTLDFYVNDQAWSTVGLPKDSAGNPVEPAWEPAGENGLHELEITLIDDETLSVTKPGSGVTHVYTPNPDPPGCA